MPITYYNVDNLYQLY